MLKKDILLITGCEGFIGSNVAKHFSEENPKYNLIGCGSLNSKEKFFNINQLNLTDYWDKDELFNNLNKVNYKSLAGIIHLGACSSTDNWDSKYLLTNNTRFSNKLVDLCIENKIRMINASSAAVYGITGEQNKNQPNNIVPINMYAFSKLLTDQYINFHYPKQNLVTSLRFFNVFGLNENHKFGMASPIHTFNEQAKSSSLINLFKEDNDAKLYQRDFINVTDIVKLIGILLPRRDLKSIYDAGSGQATSFKQVANEVAKWWNRNGKKITIREIDFPSHLKGSYQKYTCANMSYLDSLNIPWRPMSTIQSIENFLDKTNIVK